MGEVSNGAGERNDGWIQFWEHIRRNRSYGEKLSKRYEFDPTRCRILTKCRNVKPDNSGIIYLMHRDCRVYDNWAVIYAQLLALFNETCVHIVFMTSPNHPIYPTRRQFDFLVEGSVLN